MVRSFTADKAYGSSATYRAAKARGAKVVVPPSRKATVPAKRRPPLPERGRAIRRVRNVGRRRWKKESSYHCQGRVENTFYRMKSILGGRLRARHAGPQTTEAVIACKVLIGCPSWGGRDRWRSRMENLGEDDLSPGPGRAPTPGLCGFRDTQQGLPVSATIRFRRGQAVLEPWSLAA